MKASSQTLLAALLGLSVSTFSMAGFAAETAADDSAQATETPAEATATQTGIPAPKPEAAAVQSAPDETQSSPQDTPKEKDKAEKFHSKTPVTGAFGIRLGEKFAPYMVGTVLSQSDKTYKDRSEEKAEHTGTEYRVEPPVPNKYFNEYSVLTNEAGIIYSIIGKHNPAEPENKCRRTKKIARSLVDKYGKPRGRGTLGEWVAFRESVEGPYRGIRLYAPRCRTGHYSIVYSDDGAMMQAAPADVPEKMRGL